MLKRITLAVILVTAVSVCAFAGEGSDTIGACRLMPELRYSFNETPMDTEYGYYFDPDLLYNHYTFREHTATLGATWGATDNLALYAFVGAVIDSSLEGTADVYINPTAGYMDMRSKIDPDNGLTCGLGIRGTFWRSSGGLYCGGGASVAYSSTEFDGIFGHGEKTVPGYSVSYTYIIRDKFRLRNLAATADLHAGWTFKDIGLTPYLGVEYRWSKVYVKEIGQGRFVKFNARERKPVGVYVGLDYRIKDRVNVNLEGHMINRWGASASIGLLFDLCGKPAPEPEPAPAPVIEPKLEPMSSK